MPIDVATEVRVLQQTEFYALHHRLMGIIFDVHNDFGRLLDEVLFKREIAARCEAAGLAPAEREVRIRVCHEGFHKDYSVDLLVCRGLPVEAKATDLFVPRHRTQAINYLLLLGLQHGTLVNLRPERVAQEFISTGLTLETRRRFRVVDKGWKANGERCVLLKETMIALLQDWGAFLEVGLYREALSHFLGGEQAVMSRVPIFSGERLLGEQLVHLVDAKIAFSVTAMAGDTNGIREHQERFLRHTPLRALQWINLNHHDIEFCTLTNS